MKSIRKFFCLLLILSFVPGSSLHAGQKRPLNVLFIMSDDLNDWVGCLGGHPNTKTPNIDRLARQGVLFANAHVSAQSCNPSRASLLTGVRPSTSGVYHNPNDWRKHLLPKNITLPAYFRQNGYNAICHGKGFHGRQEDPTQWTKVIDFKDKLKFPEGELERSRAGAMRWGISESGDEEMGDWQIASATIQALQEKHDKPFFMVCGFHKPHTPWNLPKKYFDLHPLDSISMPEIKENDLEDVPPMAKAMAHDGNVHEGVLKSGKWKEAVRAYLAAVSFVDGQVGRVLDALDSSEFKDNTIVVFWGDHGWHLGEKEHWQKYSLWEEVTRVPLIVRMPGSDSQEKVCRRTVDSIHIFPTLCELTGLKIPSQVEGVSFTALIKDPSSAWDIPAITTFGANNHTVRSERWRYIRYLDGDEELYDHSVDPNEWENLASKPGMEKIKSELAAHLPKVNVPEEKPWFIEKGERPEWVKEAHRKRAEAAKTGSEGD
jgi:arylsulfatase A-like enzyme